MICKAHQAAAVLQISLRPMFVSCCLVVFVLLLLLLLLSGAA
jgi:hypothetical protein